MCKRHTSGVAGSCLMLFVMSPAMAQRDPVINEFVIDHVGVDKYEFVEIFGTPNTDYSSYSILVLEGDLYIGNPGVVEDVFRVGTTNATGIWWTGFLGWALDGDTVTILLVENYRGGLYVDLDPDDDGVMDVFPFDRIVDDVAVWEGSSWDLAYAQVVLRPRWDGVVYHTEGASRIPNGSDTDRPQDWVRNDYDGAGLPDMKGTLAPNEAFNTPGTPNQLTDRPPNDDCEHALVISTGEIWLSNLKADPEPEVSPCGGIGHDLWYAYTAAERGVLYVSLSGSFAGVIAVYEGCSCPAVPTDLLDCAYDGDGFSASMAVPVEAGRCYLLQAGGVAEATGSGTISLELVVTANPPPTCDAGAGYAATCQGATTSIRLDGTGSSDEEGETLAFLWTTDCPGGVFDDETLAAPTLTIDSASVCALECAVRLTVSDRVNEPVSCDAMVSIRDEAAPALSCSSDIQVEAMGPDGAEVAYEIEASDDCDPDPSVVCSAASGATFAIGDTLVTCTAADACGNVSTCAFTVSVLSPREISENLIGQVEAFVDDGSLPPNQANGLIEKLVQVIVKLDAGQTTPACNELTAFINQVEASVKSRKLSREQADLLIESAVNARSALGC